MRRLVVQLAALHLAILAVATASANSIEIRDPTIPESACNVEVLCCSSFSSAEDPNTIAILDLFGVGVSPGDKVGLQCSPLFPGAYCTAIPLCCDWGAQYQYIIAIGCQPIGIQDEA